MANPRLGTAFPQVIGAIRGRVMADGTDEDGARAAALDEWIVWEAEERVAPTTLD